MEEYTGGPRAPRVESLRVRRTWMDVREDIKGPLSSDVQALRRVLRMGGRYEGDPKL